MYGVLKFYIRYVNREDIDFSIANELTPVQEWDLHEDFKGEIEYTTR